MNIRKFITNSYEKLFSTGFFHIFGSNVINKILAFISSICVVRFVSKAEYGIYTAALNKLSFFIIFTGAGMVYAILQLCSENAKNKEKNMQIYSYGSSIAVKFNIFLAGVIVMFSYLLNDSVEGSNYLLRLLAFIPLFEIVNELQRTYFRSRLNNKVYSYANTICSICVVAFSLVGAYFFQVKGIIIGRYLASFISSIIIYFFLRGPVVLRYKYDTINFDKTIVNKIAFISLINAGLSQVLYLFDILIIGDVMGQAEAVADYKIAIIIPSALIFIPSAICTYIYPYFSYNINNKKWLVKSFKTLMLSLGLFNMVITIVMIVMAPWIIETFFGKEYIMAVPMFIVSSINYFFSGTFRLISGNLLVTQRKLKFNFIVALISGGVNIISNYILVTKFGAIGAAYTTLIISIITGIVCTIYFYYCIRSKKDEER